MDAQIKIKETLKQQFKRLKESYIKLKIENDYNKKQLEKIKDALK